MFHGEITSGVNLSLWFNGIDVPHFPILKENIKTDVCVIGAGIAGLTTAFLLAQAGRSVVVIDDGKIGSGETGRTTAHLVNALDDRYFELEKVFGLDGAKMAAESHSAAISFIENLVKKENIDCEFTKLDGYLYLHDKDSMDTLKKELAAAHRAGLLDIELLENTPRGYDLGPCLKFPNQAQFHALKYLVALARLISEKGGKIFEKTHAEKIEPNTISKVTTTNGFTISAEAIVVATNEPIYDNCKIFAKQEAERTYVIGARVKKNDLTQALLWDTGDPYYYLRLQSDPESQQHDILIVGGEDHRTGEKHNPDEQFNKLEKWARQKFPQLEDIRYRWSGQVMEPVDHLAYIGRDSKEKNLFLVTGDSGNGMTHGTIAGILLTDLILGKNNPWAELYNPARKPIKNLKETASHNLTAAAKFSQYLTPGEVNDVNEIKPETGAILRRGVNKIAVYRDKEGKLYERSAVCPHLKGIVAWNACEHSWDCPLHGSRFSPYGDVVNGPANQDLTKKSDHTED